MPLFFAALHGIAFLVGVVVLVWRDDGTEVALAAQELALLDVFVRNEGVVLSRRQLLDLAWGSDWIGDPRTVDVHVRQLRRKLGDDLPLVTVRGFGYRLG